MDTRDRLYCNYGFVYGIWLVLIAHAFGYVVDVDLANTDHLMLAIAGLHPQINIVILALVPVMLFFALRRVDAMITHMDSYAVAIWFLIAVWMANTLLRSLLLWHFSLAHLGVLHVGVAFITAGLYRKKGKRIQTHR